MKEIQRKDLYTLSRHSDISQNEIHSLLEKNVYADRKNLHKFFKIFFLSLGIGFAVFGIIFFFAFNWENLNKFIKFVLIQLLIISGTGFYLLSNKNIEVKKIVLTGTSMLVGVLFAVYGQIYQTGANAYDFFLGWTIFISIWVIIANYSPLWLLYIVLINTTFYFYVEQVARAWPDIVSLLLFLVFNTLTLITFLLLPSYRPTQKVPLWFTSLLAIFCAFLTTISLAYCVNHMLIGFTIIPMMTTIIIYILGIYYALTQKNIFYLSLIALSIIIAFMNLFIDRLDSDELFFELILFTIVTFSGAIKLLLNLQKKWKHEK